MTYDQHPFISELDAGESPLFPAGNDNMYYNLAQTLRQRITEMKVRIDRQQKALAALKSRVKDQVVEMQRLEVPETKPTDASVRRLTHN